MLRRARQPSCSHPAHTTAAASYGVPQICFAIVLLFCGTSIITLCEDNSTIIIDTFALTFVLELDELIFMVFVSPFLADSLASMPPITKTLPRDIGFELSGLCKVRSAKEFFTWIDALRNGLTDLGIDKLVAIGFTVGLAYACETLSCGNGARGVFVLMGFVSD